ncbi:(2Fe-2S) ferredoxin domain-containing protein [Victivallis sp. Marseille-Q1083]|uniref:(2Fe-2S) ferredoxin domain-containing protein n=1 Tax=Victivallis sp. Marseille-Q1083 TaxID=2717288 RepID=UPI00158C8996|nr:(2Fe-2S) ferredoxin domain-containing protein [Victivallis sp. Marseille-Q1083]
MAKNNIVICMGSSCFARGNEQNLRKLEEFLARNRISAEVHLAGSTCEGQCALGPNLKINGEIFHNVDGEMLIDLLNSKLIR